MLVFEHMEQRVFFPGELIMSVSQRSPICTGYYEFYKPRLTKFQQDLDLSQEQRDQKKMSGFVSARSSTSEILRNA